MRTVVLPKLGMQTTEAEVIEWLCQVGDHVEDGSALCEVETDKVTTEIPAPVAGTLRAIHVAEGDVVQVGEALCDIEPDA